MKSEETVSSDNIELFHWILRVLACVLLLFFLFKFFGILLGTFQTGNYKPLSTYHPFELMMIFTGGVGLGLALKWELAGGIIALAAYVILGAMGAYNTVILLLYPLTSVLFIIEWWLNRRLKI